VGVQPAGSTAPSQPARPQPRPHETRQQQQEETKIISLVYASSLVIGVLAENEK
jgi:hypothetical protein